MGDEERTWRIGDKVWHLVYACSSRMMVADKWSWLWYAGVIYATDSEMGGIKIAYMKYKKYWNGKRTDISPWIIVDEAHPVYLLPRGNPSISRDDRDPLPPVLCPDEAFAVHCDERGYEMVYH